jgi:hypothetical protein
MKWRALTTAVGTFTTLLLMNGCSESLKTGGLYSVDDGEGWYRIAKVLVVEPEGVHIRLYKNKFKSRPPTVEPTSLSLGTVHDTDGFGMGHLPLTHRAFAAWQPVFVSTGLVTEEELEGYRMWQGGKGGFFGRK